MDGYSHCHSLNYSKLCFERQLQTLPSSDADHRYSLVNNNDGESFNPTTHSLVAAGACGFNKGRQDLPTPRKQPRMSPAICNQPLSTRRTPPELSTATSPSKTMAISRRGTALSELPFVVDDEQHIPDYSIMRRMPHVLASIDVAT
jgi:hypothetical protein